MLIATAVEGGVGLSLTLSSKNPSAIILFMETTIDPNTVPDSKLNGAKKLDFDKCEKCELLIQENTSEFLMVTGGFQDTGNGDLWMLTNGSSNGKEEIVTVIVK